ncbi:hypothetical protein QYH69_32330 [Paraburkholderia sp. SARCC-3016]|uniref:hypothetical protein n=1 Tax=Paraburkholderia sp. SARCC-3016 TaxID=3058611 RepID=UPI0028086721|nr:hypothetical protein [Paraburkholderia sp. SARCC-3016]MDQ7981912.1 hypothetical protein [Paraburkholderia sp. SARCC-3016]
MSEAKHSPGPWHLHEETHWPFKLAIIAANGDEVSIESRSAYGSGQKSIDDVMSARGFRDVDQREDAIAANARQLANAKLRAAAPELLAELQAAHRIIRNALSLMTTDQQAQWSEINERAALITDGATRAHEREAVIAKATGAA